MTWLGVRGRVRGRVRVRVRVRKPSSLTSLSPKTKQTLLPAQPASL